MKREARYGFEKKPAKSTRAAVRALRSQRRKAYYATQPMRTAKNKRVRMRRHLRAHPADVRSSEEYESRFGGARDIGLTARGKKRARRATGSIRSKSWASNTPTT